MKDRNVIKEIIVEALQGNRDARFCVSRSQQALVMSSLYDIIADRIEQTANRLSMNGLPDLARDGIIVANRLRANAKLLRYSLADRVRAAWSGRGEEPIPESKSVLQATTIVKEDLRFRSSKDEIQTYYLDDARFFLPSIKSDLEREEKRVLFHARHNAPIMNSGLPEDIRMKLGIFSKPSDAFILSYFSERAAA